MFKVETTKKKFNANTVKFDGKYPYVARSSTNNGIRGYINPNEIDYDFIENFIRAQSKMALKDVVNWKNKIISTT